MDGKYTCTDHTENKSVIGIDEHTVIFKYL
jgi:hypothetical protein